MKHLLTLLLLAACAVTAQGQTIKTLGYNTTNGNVVYKGTNVLTFTNNVGFSSGRIEIGSGLGFWDGADGTYALFFQGDDPVLLNGRWNDNGVRASLGLPLAALTNTNVTNFRSAIGLGASNSVSFNDLRIDELIIDGEDGIGFENEDGKANTRSAVGLPLPALTNTSNVTMMRALAGSTNTNQPYTGDIYYTDPEDSTGKVIVVQNGIILRIYEGP